MKYMIEPDLETTSSDVVTELLREYHGAEFTESEMENDSVGCISMILEDLRAGTEADEFYCYVGYVDRTAHQEEYLALLKPEDMKWLMMSGMPEEVCMEGTVTHELMGIVWFLKHYAGYDCIQDLKIYKSRHICQ